MNWGRSCEKIFGSEKNMKSGWTLSVKVFKLKWFRFRFSMFQVRHFRNICLLFIFGTLFGIFRASTGSKQSALVLERASIMLIDLSGLNSLKEWKFLEILQREGGGHRLEQIHPLTQQILHHPHPYQYQDQYQ